MSGPYIMHGSLISLSFPIVGVRKDLLFFNEEGKINSFTDWFDAGGVQDQIEKALEN